MLRRKSKDKNPVMESRESLDELLIAGVELAHQLQREIGRLRQIVGSDER